MLGAQKRAIGAELVWPTVAAGWVRLGACAPQLLEGLAGGLQHCADVGALRVAVEDFRQEIVDGDVAGGGLPRKPGDEPHEPGARAIRQAELQLRHLLRETILMMRPK